jgi:hypothetical protein
MAIGFFPDLLSFARAVMDAVLSPGLQLGTVSPTGTKPLWVVTITYVGLVTYFLIAFSVFCQTVHDRGVNSLKKWLAFWGFLLFGGLVAPFLAGLSAAEASLMGRGVTYLYFLTAPLVAGFLIRLCKQNLKSLGRPILAAFLIFIVLTPAVYYGVVPGIYDRNAPEISGDVRMSLGEWQVAAGCDLHTISWAH